MSDEWKILFTDDNTAEGLTKRINVLGNAIAATNARAVDLADDFDVFSKRIESAASVSKRASSAWVKMGTDAAGASVGYDKVSKSIASTRKSMDYFVDATAKGMSDLAAPAKNIASSFGNTTKGIQALVRAETLLGTSISSTVAAMNAEKATLASLIANYSKKGKYTQEDIANNNNIIASTQRILELDKQLAIQNDNITTTIERLSSMTQAETKALDSVIMTKAALSRQAEILKAKMDALRKSMSPAGTREYAEQQLKLSQFQAAYNTVIGNTIKLKERETSVSAKATAAAKSSQAAAGIKGSISTQDTQLLANLRRVGLISPQVAQLSYVIEMLTSKGMIATVAVVGLTVAMAKLGMASVKAAAELQRYNVTLQALSTHGWDAADRSQEASRALGKAVSGDMIAYATNSIYAFDKIAEGTEKLVGYGLDMRVVNQEMEMLGNLALGDSERLSNLAVAYGQVYGQGKARAQEMYQFVNAGIPIFEELAKKMTNDTGIIVTTDAVMDMTKKGEIGFTMVRDLLKDLTSEGGRYYNLMKQIAGLSFEGQWTVFQNQLKVMTAGIGDKLLPSITSMLIQLNSTLSRFNATKGVDYVKKTFGALNTYTPKTQDYMVAALASSDLEEYQRRYKAKQELDARFKSKGAALTSASETFDLLATPSRVPDAKIAESVNRDRLKTVVETFKKDFGMTFSEINEILLKTVFKGLKLSTTDMLQDPTALINSIQAGLNFGFDQDTSDTYDQLRAALRNSIATAAETNYNRISKDAKGLTASGDLIAGTELKRREIDLDGEGKRKDDDLGPERDFKLAAYIKQLEDEQRVLTELVPKYKEWVNISLLAAQDQEKKVKGKVTLEGKSESDLEKEQEKARTLWEQNYALDLVNKSYASLYEYSDGRMSAEAREINEAFDSLAKLRLTERGSALSGLDTLFSSGSLANGAKGFARQLLSISKSIEVIAKKETLDSITRAFTLVGATPGEGVAKAKSIGTSLNGTSTLDNGTSLLATTLNEYMTLKGLKLDDLNLTEDQIALLKQLYNAKGQAYTEDVISMSEKYNSALTAEEVEVQKLIAAWKLATDEKKKYRLGKDIDNAMYAQLGLDEATRTKLGMKETLDGSKIKPRVDYLDKGIQDTALNMATNGVGMGATGLMQKALDAQKFISDNKGIAGSELDVAKIELELKGYNEELSRVITKTEMWADVMTSVKDAITNMGLAALEDSLYTLGTLFNKNSDYADSFEERMKDLARTMVNQLPTIFLQASVGAFSAGMWPMGMALLAAGAGTAIMNGVMGSKETMQDEQDNDTYLANLQAQFQTMIEQFQTGLLYLESARSKYVMDEKIRQVEGYAKGDMFPGSTGLAHGVYNQPTFFRFASGQAFNGVMGEAGAEAILPLQRGPDGKLGVTASGSGSEVVVVINNNAAGVAVTPTETVDSNGQKQIRIMVENIISGTLASGGADRALSARYGIRPTASMRG